MARVRSLVVTFPWRERLEVRAYAADSGVAISHLIKTAVRAYIAANPKATPANDESAPLSLKLSQTTRLESASNRVGDRAGFRD